MEKDLVLIQTSLDRFDLEIKYRQCVLTALEKIYNFYTCITTLDYDIILQSKRINYDPKLLSISEITGLLVKELHRLSCPINNLLFKCDDWKVAIHTIPSYSSDSSMLFISFIPEGCLHYRRAIQWGYKMMIEHHH